MLKDYFDDYKYQELKESDNLIYKALELVSKLFENDVDKGGYPYLVHLLTVYLSVNTYEQKIVALLHDVIEDKDISEGELLDIGFPKNIVDDVKILSRDKQVEYKNYINNLVENASKNALNVKLADLKHNMDLTRIKNPSITDLERVSKRYTPAYEKIINRLEEMEK